jgi:magnesium transporter
MAKKKLIPPKKPSPAGKNNAFREDAPMEIEIVIFDEDSVKVQTVKDFTAIKQLIDRKKLNLIFINNLTEPHFAEQLGNYFTIDPLTIEDALSVADIPSIQESGDQMLLTLKLMIFKESGKLVNKHIGLLLGEFYVIVFKDSETNVFDEIKTRIENGTSKAKLKKTDYLFYLLIDSVIDTYYTVINEIDNKIDKMEATVLERPQTNYMHNLYRIKQPISEMRGVIYPTREALHNLVQGDFHLIGEETIPFLKDIKDHMNNILHMYDSSRDTLSDLLEINNSNINNRLNNSMKVLTIITTIFIPLTLITGIYGMNFKNMPELSWKWGYPGVLVIMLITAGIMYLFMKRKKLL